MVVINERSFPPLPVNPPNWGEKKLVPCDFLSILEEHDHDSVEKAHSFSFEKKILRQHAKGKKSF